MNFYLAFIDALRKLYNWALKDKNLRMLVVMSWAQIILKYFQRR